MGQARDKTGPHHSGGEGTTGVETSVPGLIAPGKPTDPFPSAL
jgi:hypothetical protein